LNAAGLAMTGIDIYNNGLNWSNGTDAVIGIVGFVPGVGWIISAHTSLQMRLSKVIQGKV